MIAGSATMSVMVDARVSRATAKRRAALHRFFRRRGSLCRWRMIAPQSTARGNSPRGRMHQHDQEGDVAGEDLPFRIDVGADRLRQPHDDAAGERAPQAAEPADDHRLEGVEEPRRADARVEIGAGAEKERGEGADRERNRPWSAHRSSGC